MARLQFLEDEYNEEGPPVLPRTSSRHADSAEMKIEGGAFQGDRNYSPSENEKPTDARVQEWPIGPQYLRRPIWSRLLSTTTDTLLLIVVMFFPGSFC